MIQVFRLYVPYLERELKLLCVIPRAKKKELLLC